MSKSHWQVAARLLFGQGLVLLTAMAANVAAARTLGASGRGEVALILQASYILVTALLLGRDRALTVAVLPSGASTADERALLRVPWLLALPASLVVGSLASGPSTQPLVMGACLAGLVVVGMATRMRRAGAILGSGPHSFLSRLALGQAALAVCVAVAYAATAGNAEVWVAIYLVAGLPFVFPYCTRTAREVGSTRLRSIQRTGRHLLPAALAEILLLRFERVLLPLMSTYATLGVYVAVATITELAAWPAQQYADAKSPVWAKQGLSRNQIWRESAFVVSVSLVAATALGAVAWVALEPIFGSEFASGKSLIPGLAAAAVGTALYRVVYAMAASASVRRVGLILTCSGLLAAGMLYPASILLFGAAGAAWGSALGLFVASILGLVGLSSESSRHSEWHRDCDAKSDDCSQPEPSGLRNE